MVEAADNSDDDYSTISTESLDINDFCPNVTSTAERPSIASFGRRPLRRADTPIPLSMAEKKFDNVAEGVLEENVLDADNRGLLQLHRDVVKNLDETEKEIKELTATLEREKTERVEGIKPLRVAEFLKKLDAKTQELLERRKKTEEDLKKKSEYLRKCCDEEEEKRRLIKQAEDKKVKLGPSEDVRNLFNVDCLIQLGTTRLQDECGYRRLDMTGSDRTLALRIAKYEQEIIADQLDQLRQVVWNYERKDYLNEKLKEEKDLEIKRLNEELEGKEKLLKKLPHRSPSIVPSDDEIDEQLEWRRQKEERNKRLRQENLVHRSPKQQERKINLSNYEWDERMKEERRNQCEMFLETFKTFSNSQNKSMLEAVKVMKEDPKTSVRDFSGDDPNIRAELWIQDVDDYVESKFGSQFKDQKLENKKILFAEKFFTGSARLWKESRNRLENKYLTYMEWRELFLETMSKSQGNMKNWEDDMEECVQQMGESLRSYTLRKMQLMNYRPVSKNREPLSLEDIKEWITKGLTDRIVKTTLMTMDFGSMGELLKHMIDLDREEKKRRGIVQQRINAGSKGFRQRGLGDLNVLKDITPKVMLTVGQEEEEDYDEGFLSEAGSQNTSRGSNQNVSTGKVMTTNLAQNCAQPNSRVDFGDRQPNGYSYDQCRLCREFGHWSYYCPNVVLDNMNSNAGNIYRGGRGGMYRGSFNGNYGQNGRGQQNFRGNQGGHFRGQFNNSQGNGGGRGNYNGNNFSNGQTFNKGGN